MQDELISREAVRNIVNDIRDCISVEGYWAICERLKKLPPANPTKTGHWIYKQYGGYPECGNWHCSKCDEIDNRIPAYCSHCGARMIEPQESEE